MIERKVERSGMDVMKLVGLLSLASGCTLSHVDPSPRSNFEMRDTSVQVRVSCGGDDDIWSVDRRGSGVLLSGRHVVTAAHVVSCPGLPTVRVRVGDWSYRAYVEREDLVDDLARLVIASDGEFSAYVIPPARGYPTYGQDVCVALSWPVTRLSCGHYLGMGYIDVGTPEGTSGAPVYTDDGLLLGVVTTGDGVTTHVTIVPPEMYAGT